MRLLVVEAAGVLYRSEETPPNALPITSGLRFVRALTEGLGVPVAVVAQLDAVNAEAVLQSWLKTYDVTYAHTIHGSTERDTATFWEQDVLAFLGSLQAQPPAVVTSSPLVAMMLSQRAVPTVQFRPPDGNAPNWGPTRSSWANKYALIEEGW